MKCPDRLTSLSVVVVDEDEGLVGLGHAPAVVDNVAQLVEVVDAPGDLHRVAELGWTACLGEKNGENRL